ncbi:MAG: phosphotransferase [Candidatus Poribacteria bacterium]|nr:phosphotransferase [Candidatus Poribacteria bacterium]
MITSAEQITPQWLTTRFQQKGYLSKGTATDVHIGETFESTAAFLTPLKVTYSLEAENLPHSHLIFKQYRKEWFGGGIAESAFFNEIAAHTPEPPIFHCYDVAYDPSTQYCYFLFEDASVTHAKDPPKAEAFTIELYKQIIDELLKFHTHWWEHPRISQDDFLRGRGGPLRMIDAATPEIIQRDCQNWRGIQLPRFADTFQDEFSQEMYIFARRAIDNWEGLYIDRIRDGKHLTLLHGDLHRWNIFYPKNPSIHGLYFLDWETYKRGIGPYDLCYLVGWEASERRREIERDLLRYYYQGLVSDGILGYSWEDCVYDYRLSAIATLFPAIGWRRSFEFENQRVRFEDWDCHELLD